MKQPTLFDVDAAPDPERPPDQAARDFAVDPGHHVVLEASAGTGKTRVLVERYARLIASGVDPRHILAITFTRKAAAEMRERVVTTLRERGEQGGLGPGVWETVRGRLTRIEISTIDAFCFALLREFPLEADVDPGFDVADETETGRFAGEALDRAFRLARPLIQDDEHVRLLFARVKAPVLRDVLATLLDRRQVAVPAIATFVARHQGVGNADEASARFLRRVQAAWGPPDRRRALLADGPVRSPDFAPVADDIAHADAVPAADHARVRALRARLEQYFLTQAGKPRQRVTRPYAAAHFVSPAAKRRHEEALAAASPDIKAACDALDADLDVLLARGLQRLLALAVAIYTRLLEENALLDFAGMLEHAVALLERQEEFARSRLKLQSRYHHLLIDEFQDTSRRQWRLIELLVDAWGEGEGAADAPTSVFVVGDRKQSIYRFRHAEVTLFDEVVRRIQVLSPGVDSRRAITTSFRAVPELLAFVNTLAGGLEGDESLADRWRYDDRDRFPVPAVSPGARRDGQPVLGLVAASSIVDAAAAVAEEVAAVIGRVMVRDRSGAAREARADDVAILFRSRAGHQVFEEALERRGIRTYVYKGLGFFDAPEVQDLQALLRYLAQPESRLRTAEFLRSRLARLSDDGLARVAPMGPRVLTDPACALGGVGLSDVDRVLLDRLRESVPRWLSLADRVPPSELIDTILGETAYSTELAGRRLEQARENVKKVRAIVRRVENRGYTSLGRLAAYFETLRFGDDSNAIVEAAEAVNLMTIHAAKGLEFPIVFLVNLHMGGRGGVQGVSVVERGPEGHPVVSFGTSDATRLEDAREAEELRRLLYVATTRARDRLYFAAEVDGSSGQLRRGARSLASLLPPSLAATFAAAWAAPSDQLEVEWVTEDGAFTFRVCRPPVPTEGARETTPTVAPAPEAERMPLPAFTPVRVTGRDVRGATELPIDAPRTAVGRPPVSEHDERLLGTLVHRFVAARLDPGAMPGAALVAEYLTPEERVDVRNPADFAQAAWEVYARLLDDVELRAVLRHEWCLFEVPLSWAPPDRPGEVVRGVVDALLVLPERAVVIEIKTGVPRPEHDAQGELYRRAIECLLPGRAVEVRICYPPA